MYPSNGGGGGTYVVRYLLSGSTLLQALLVGRCRCERGIVNDHLAIAVRLLQGLLQLASNTLLLLLLRIVLELDLRVLCVCCRAAAAGAGDAAARRQWARLPPAPRPPAAFQAAAQVAAHRGPEPGPVTAQWLPATEQRVAQVARAEHGPPRAAQQALYDARVSWCL